MYIDDTDDTTSQPADIAAATHSNAAYKAYTSSKEAATYAVAHAYLVYLNTQKPGGDKWLADQVTTRNSEITKHNQSVQQRETDVETYKAQKKVNPKTVPTQQVADDINLSDEEWTALERTKIDTPRKGASPFTTLAKFVFKFDHNYHASNTSRYCAVLEWLDAKFNGQLITTVAPLVDAISKAGGFEKVLFLQRRGEPDDTGYAAGDREIIEAELKKRIKTAIATANVKASFAMTPNHATSDNVVIMYGLHVNGTVSVIDEVPLESGEVDGMLRKLDNKTLLAVDDAAEFVSRVLSLGELVETGKKTKHRLHKLAAAQEIKVYSLFSMIPDGADTKLMISGCMTNTSVVVHAKPVGNIAPNLVQTQDYLSMLKPSHKELATKLRDRTSRTFYTLSRDAVPVRNDGKPSGSQISWSLTNSALASKKRNTAERRMFWDYMAKGNYHPINVEPYTTQFTATMTQTELSPSLLDYLKQFKSLTSDKSQSNAMTLRFETDKLTIIYKGQDDRIVPINAALSQTFEIMLRPHDVYGIVSKLKQFEVPVVTLSGNINGVFKVSFSDGMGEFDIYIPTCDADQQLTPKFFEKLVPPMPADVGHDNDDDNVGDDEAA
jgi:hypothetical protein